jgi:hypothetical protein
VPSFRLPTGRSNTILLKPAGAASNKAPAGPSGCCGQLLVAPHSRGCQRDARVTVALGGSEHDRIWMTRVPPMDCAGHPS